jgi:tetratricopeptide (TPR) repeat protein
MEDGFRYRAFISYSSQDKAVAVWLLKALEGYVLPSRLVGKDTPIGPAPKRLTPIFRDRDELPAAGDLSTELQAALAGSRFLIVLCSPASARSRWTNREVQTFKQLHGEERVLALILDGKTDASPFPDAQGNPGRGCFPPALRYRLGPDGDISSELAHPLAADIRPGQDGKRLALLKLIAGLTGVRLDDLVQREAQRRIRRLTAVAIASAMGMVLAGGLALYANEKRLEAIAERARAEQETATANAAVDYLVKTFAIANPATENPRTITALTMLQRGADRIDQELASQPQLQLRLYDTISRVYNNLGLYDQALDLLARAKAKANLGGPNVASALLTLATTHLRAGRLKEAEATVADAERVLGADPKQSPDVRGRAAELAGLIKLINSDPKGALTAYDRALSLYQQARYLTPEVIARTDANRGNILAELGRLEEAQRALENANRIYRQTLGERHATTGLSYNSLAQTALDRGDLATAKRNIAQALSIFRNVQGPDSLETAGALALQGEILRGQKLYSPALASLSQALKVYEKLFNGPHYLKGTTLGLMAIVEADRRNISAAREIIARARAQFLTAQDQQDGVYGDLLVKNARIDYLAGDIQEADVNCQKGLTLMLNTLGATSPYYQSGARFCSTIRRSP